MNETLPTWPDYQLEWLPHTFDDEAKFAAAKQKAVIATWLDENGKRCDAFIPYSEELDPHTPKAQAKMRQLLSDAYIDMRRSELSEAERNQEGVTAKLHAQYGLSGTHS